MNNPLPLNPTECRVLGVLVEKAQTVPATYPMTINGLTSGCNQKNNRDPVTAWPEERVQHALDTLRTKGIVKEVRLSNDRVAKYRHIAREVLGVTTEQLVILAELLLRGPQSVGEIRGRASRMAALDSVETTQALLESLMNHQPPVAAPQALNAVWPVGSLVQEHPAPAGSRAKLYSQLLCPTLHPIPVSGAASDAEGVEGTTAPARPTELVDLRDRVERLESETAELRRLVDAMVQGKAN